MGYMVELNTLIGLPKGFDVSTLKTGTRFSLDKERERAFPLHVAMLIVDSEWNFYGYGVAHSIIVKEQRTQIEIEVLTLFSSEEQKMYKEKFMTAAKLTGEII